jgi:hypothetical protein
MDRTVDHAEQDEASSKAKYYMILLICGIRPKTIIMIIIIIMEYECI